MKKVTVTKEVGKELDEKLHGLFSKEEVIEWHVKNRFRSGKVLNKEAGKISTTDLMNALIVGYEVEKPLPVVDMEGFNKKEAREIASANREIVQMINRHKNDNIFTYGDGITDGINFTLSQLGIKLDTNI